MIPERIVNAVAENYNVSVNLMMGRSRPEHVAFPRQVAMYLCRTILGVTFTQVGEWFGGRDHGTVLHACKRIENLTGSQRQEVMRLAARLGRPELEFAGALAKTILVRERGKMTAPVFKAVVQGYSDAEDYVNLEIDGKTDWFPVNHFMIIGTIGDKLLTSCD